MLSGQGMPTREKLQYRVQLSHLVHGNALTILQQGIIAHLQYTSTKSLTHTLHKYKYVYKLFGSFMCFMGVQTYVSIDHQKQLHV